MLGGIRGLWTLCTRYAEVISAVTVAGKKKLLKTLHERSVVAEERRMPARGDLASSPLEPFVFIPNMEMERL